GAYLTYGNEGTHNLNLVDLKSFPSLPEIANTSIDEALTITDYLFYEGDLFYVGNEKSPLTWSLVRYSNGEKDFVSDSASYNDYMQIVDDKLAYYQIDGQVTNIYLYDSEGTVTLLDAEIESPTVDLERTETEIAGLNA